MRVRLNLGYMRGFSHSSTNYRNRRIPPSKSPFVQSRSRTTADPSSPSPSPSLSPSPATTTSQATTRSRGSRNADTARVMTIGSVGYDGYIPFDAAALSPLAPAFNPTQGSQPSHGLPLSRPIPFPHQPALSQKDQEHDYSPLRPHLVPPPAIPPAKRERQRDKITQPSPESGGVPDPTQEYLALASHPPFLLPYARSLLVVIDLNGTLLHRPYRHSPTRFVERPFARAFLSYCVNTFTVVIWSSARPTNVDNMCQRLLTPEDRAKVVAVWGRDSFGLSKADYNLRVQCYKRLTKLWNDPVVAASHPNGEQWNQLNTVLVDDSTEKARSEPFNLIQIPDFTGDANEPGFVLPQVHDYLNYCSQQTNVSAYMRNQPFKIRPDFTLSMRGI
ncbi:HAD-like domain-containing protein [Xylaria sp. FL0043]|nr:HAD-like domain-containing protein [Xylaria sp. FL0043]